MGYAELKFGHISGGKAAYPLPMAASEVIKSQSGRFVKNSSGYGAIAGDSDGELVGFVEGGDQTCGSSNGDTVLNCIFDPSAIFRLPLAYDGSTYTVNFSQAVVHGEYDLIVISNIQKVNLTTQTEGTVVVVGGKAATSTTSNDGYVDVRLNPETMQ